MVDKIGCFVFIDAILGTQKHSYCCTYFFCTPNRRNLFQIQAGGYDLREICVISYTGTCLKSERVLCGFQYACAKPFALS